MATNLDVADNSGARRVMCIKVLGARSGATRRSGTSSWCDQGGDPRGASRATCLEAVSCAPPRTSATRRSVIRFDSNAAVLINNQGRADRHPIFGGAARAAPKESRQAHLAGAGVL